MKVHGLVWLGILAFLISGHGQIAAQTAAGDGSAPTTGPIATKDREAAANKVDGHLRVQAVQSPTELAVALAFLKCDAKNNLYFMTAPDGVRGIHKLNASGERIGLFLPDSPGVKIDFPQSFSITPDGYVYQLIHAHEATRYVFVYRPDGTLKSTISLQAGSAFDPHVLAVFPSGDFLVSGLEYAKGRDDPIMWPFSRIFSADGTVRRELKLRDDEQIHDLAAAGDPRVTPADRPSSNRAVSGGTAESGPDGNVYLMRRLSPAIIYAISPGGEVRRFTVDPGQPDLMPVGMHVGGDRIAVLFWHPQTGEETLKVIDLRGHQVASYEEPTVNGAGQLGLAFACYARNPDRFTFLETGNEHRLRLLTATPQ